MGWQRTPETGELPPWRRAGGAGRNLARADGEGGSGGVLEHEEAVGDWFEGVEESGAHQSGAAHDGGTGVKGDAGGGPVKRALAPGVGSGAIVRRQQSSRWHRQGQTETGAPDQRWGVQGGGRQVTRSLCGCAGRRLASQLEHLLGGITGSRDGRPGGLEPRRCSTGQRSTVSRGE
jgi:hypothetical protein